MPQNIVVGHKQLMAEAEAEVDSMSTADAIAVPLADYRAWLAAMPKQTADAITAAWGVPETDPAFFSGHFRFPCLRAGNVLILLQPESQRLVGSHLRRPHRVASRASTTTQQR